MMKFKHIAPFLLTALILGLATASFGQESCNVASTPVSRATDTGLTEPAGDITFNCTFGGVPTTTATITIDYGVPITNSTGHPPAKPIQIQTAQGAAPSIVSVVNSLGQVVVSVPVQNTPLLFTVSGVLVSLSGSGKTVVNASVSVSPGNNVLITAGQTNPVVISSVLPGLRAPILTGGVTPGIILGTGVPVTTLTTPVTIQGGFALSISENYIDMFRSQTQFNAGGSTQGVQLLLTFNGIPPGVTLSGAAGAPCGLVVSSAQTQTGSAVFVTNTNRVLTSTTNTFQIEIASANQTLLENLTVACPFGVVSPGTTLPLPPGNITVTATLAPIGIPLSSSGQVLTSATDGLVPRYTQSLLPSPPLTVVTILAASTNILFPYVSIGNGFDTGFAIANTTVDPYGASGGGAVGQSGTVALYFFPVGGVPFCVTTGGFATIPIGGGSGATNCSVLSSTNIGLGLSSGGVLAAGASWVVLGSEVFRNISGAPTVFNGYVFAVANVSHAHATSFVVDATFSGKFTSGGPALVLPVPKVLSRANLAGTTETLNH
jgi:hypothetical protein